MQGVFFLGVLATLVIEGLAYIGVQGWRRAFPAPEPQRPITDAQRANQRSYEQMLASRATIGRVRLHRRTKLGARVYDVEDNPFEDA